MKIKREQLKRARKEIGVTQEKFAEMIGISIDHYKDIECERGNPSIPVFFNICKVLKKPAHYFFSNSDPYLTTEQLNQLMNFDKKDLETLLSILQALYEEQTKNSNIDEVCNEL